MLFLGFSVYLKNVLLIKGILVPEYKGFRLFYAFGSGKQLCGSFFFYQGMEAGKDIFVSALKMNFLKS